MGLSWLIKITWDRETIPQSYRISWSEGGHQGIDILSDYQVIFNVPCKQHGFYFFTYCTGDRDQDHPQEKETQKSEMALRGRLTNSWEKKRSEKQRRKGKIYPFDHRVPKNRRRDKKAFLNHQYKEIEENNRMGKTRDLLKKIRDTKGTFHAKMGTIKDRNGMDLTEAEYIKNRWQEYTELYKKMPQTVMMVWPLTYSQTSWIVRSSGP